MCGIAGIVREASHDALAHDIQRMCDAIVHRGPDDAGYYVAPSVALGMRRLSIIDVAGGHQPIANEDGSCSVVFNGEIYNHHALREILEARGHRFRTRSDTEVLIHGYEEWGDDVVHHLQGMFTLAIWDTTRNRLFVARDHLGIKPLYYWPTTAGVAFCSELRSFVALPEFPRDISVDAVVAFLALGYVPHPLCIFRATRKLSPGCRLHWTRKSGTVVERYWDPAAIAPQDGMSLDAAAEQLRSHLDVAVQSHLESEVPLGAFLSGGLDSSTVVALMARHHGGRVRTFSVGFEDQAFDESAHAEVVAQVLGTEHTTVVLRPTAEMLVDKVVRMYDEPFADSSALPTFLVSLVAREDVTVSLSGDGGDELFGGYKWYAALADRPRQPPPGGALARLAARLWPQGVPGRGRLLDVAGPRHERLNARHASALAVAEGGVLRPRNGTPLPAIGDWFQDVWARVDDYDFVSQMTRVDLSYYLSGDILTKVDRASMAVSLEARVPLLHLPLVEFALTLPGALKCSNGSTKHVLRKAVEGLVPGDVLKYPKRGFSVPLAKWLRGDLRSRLDSLAELATEFDGLIDCASVERLVRQHAAGTRNHADVLWRLLVLRAWLANLRSGDLARPTGRLRLADVVTAGGVTARQS